MNNKEKRNSSKPNSGGMKSVSRRVLSVMLAITLTISTISGVCNFNSIRSDASEFFGGSDSHSLEETSVDGDDLTLDSSGLELSQTSDGISMESFGNSDEILEEDTTEEASTQAKDDTISMQSAAEASTENSATDDFGLSASSQSVSAEDSKDQQTTAVDIDTMAKQDGISSLSDEDSEDETDESSQEDTTDATTEASTEETATTEESANTEETSGSDLSDLVDQATTEDLSETDEATTETTEASAEEASTEDLTSEESDEISMLADDPDTAGTHKHNGITFDYEAKGVIQLSKSDGKLCLYITSYGTEKRIDIEITGEDQTISIYLTGDTIFYFDSGYAINFTLNICLNGYQLDFLENTSFMVGESGNLFIVDGHNYDGNIKIKELENAGKATFKDITIDCYNAYYFLDLQGEPETTFEGCTINGNDVGLYHTNENDDNAVINTIDMDYCEFTNFQCVRYVPSGNENTDITMKDSTITLTEGTTQTTITDPNGEISLTMDHSTIQGFTGTFSTGMKKVVLKNGSKVIGAEGKSGTTNNNQFIGASTTGINLTMSDESEIILQGDEFLHCAGSEPINISMEDSKVTVNGLTEDSDALIFGDTCSITFEGENTFPENAILYGGGYGGKYGDQVEGKYTLKIDGEGSVSGLTSLINPFKTSNTIEFDVNGSVRFPDTECLIYSDKGASIVLDGEGTLPEANSLIKIIGATDNYIRLKESFDFSGINQLIYVDNVSPSTQKTAIHLNADKTITGPTTILKLKGEKTINATLDIESGTYHDLVMAEIPKDAANGTKAVINLNDGDFEGITFSNQSNTRSNITLVNPKDDYTYSGDKFMFDLTTAEADLTSKKVIFDGDGSGTTLKFSDERTLDQATFEDKGAGSALTVAEGGKATLTGCEIKESSSEDGACIVNEANLILKEDSKITLSANQNAVLSKGSEMSWIGGSLKASDGRDGDDGIIHVTAGSLKLSGEISIENQGGAKNASYFELDKGTSASVTNGLTLKGSVADSKGNIFELNGGTITFGGQLSMEPYENYFIHVSGEDLSTVSGTIAFSEEQEIKTKAILCVDGGHLQMKDTKISDNTVNNSAITDCDLASVLLLKDGEAILDNVEIKNNFLHAPNYNAGDIISGAVVIQDGDTTLKLKNGTKIYENNIQVVPEILGTMREMYGDIVYPALDENHISLDTSFSGKVGILNKSSNDTYTYVHEHIPAIPVNGSKGTVFSDDYRIELQKKEGKEDYWEEYHGQILAMTVSYGGPFVVDDVGKTLTEEDGYFLKITSVTVMEKRNPATTSQMEEYTYTKDADIARLFNKGTLNEQWYESGTAVEDDNTVKANLDYDVVLAPVSNYFEIDEEHQSDSILTYKNVEKSKMTVSDWKNTGVKFTYDAGIIKLLEGTLAAINKTSEDRTDEPACGDEISIIFRTKLKDININPATVYRYDPDTNTYEKAADVTLTSQSVTDEVQWNGTYRVSSDDLGKILFYMVADNTADYYNPDILDADGKVIVIDDQELEGIGLFTKEKCTASSQSPPAIKDRQDSDPDVDTGSVTLNIVNRALKEDGSQIDGYIEYRIKGEDTSKIQEATAAENQGNQITISKLKAADYQFRYPAIYEKNGVYSYEKQDGSVLVYHASEWVEENISNNITLGTITLLASHTGETACGVSADKEVQAYQALDKVVASFELADTLSWGSSVGKTVVGSFLKLRFYRYNPTTGERTLVKGSGAANDTDGYYCRITGSNPTASYTMTGEDVGMFIYVVVEPNKVNDTLYHGRAVTQSETDVKKHASRYEVPELTPTAPSDTGKSDGFISGDFSTVALDYSTDLMNWTSISTNTEQLEGLKEGTYYFRTSETATYLAGTDYTSVVLNEERESVGNVSVKVSHVGSGDCDATKTNNLYQATDRLTATFELSDGLSWGSVSKKDHSKVGNALKLAWIRYTGTSADTPNGYKVLATTSISKSSLTSEYIMTKEDVGYEIGVVVYKSDDDTHHNNVVLPLDSKVVKHNAVDSIPELSVVKPTSSSSKDGLITGITDDLEISTDGGKTFHLATSDANYNSSTKCLEGLSNVEIYVRTAETDTHKAGEAEKLSGTARSDLGTLTITPSHVTTGKCTVKTKTPPDYMVLDKLTAKFTLSSDLSWGNVKADGSTVGDSITIKWMRYKAGKEDEAKIIDAATTTVTKSKLTSTYVMTTDDIGYIIKAVAVPNDSDYIHKKVETKISSAVIKHVKLDKPATLTSVKASSSTAKDGQILGGVKAYEFRLTTTDSNGNKTTSSWIKATSLKAYNSTNNSLQGLEPGTYEYRYAETDETQTGTQIRSIEVKVKSTSEIKFKGNEANSNSTSTSTASSGQGQTSSSGTASTTQSKASTTAAQTETKKTTEEAEEFTFYDSVYLNSTIVSKANDLYSATLSTSDQTLLAAGKKISIHLTSRDIIDEISDSDMEICKSALENGKLGAALDLNLYKQTDNSYKQISSTASPIKIRIRVPEQLLNWDSTKQRKFSILRIHEGEPTLIDADYDAYTRSLTFDTSQFSTYMLVYEDSDVNLTLADHTWQLLNSRTVLIFSCMLSIALIALLVYDRRRRSSAGK